MIEITITSKDKKKKVILHGEDSYEWRWIAEQMEAEETIPSLRTQRKADA